MPLCKHTWFIIHTSLCRLSDATIQQYCTNITSNYRAKSSVNFISIFPYLHYISLRWLWSQCGTDHIMRLQWPNIWHQAFLANLLTHVAPSSCASYSASPDLCAHLPIIFPYLLGPFHGAIVFPSVTHFRCRRRRRRGHRCARGTRQYR